MTECAPRACVLLPDLDAVSASERAVGGMPVLLRLLCALREAGIGRFQVVAPPEHGPRVALDDPRLAPQRDTTGDDGPVLVIRGDLVYARELLARLADAAVGTVVSGPVGDRAECVAWVAPAATAAALSADPAGAGPALAAARLRAERTELEPAPGAVLPVRSSAEVRRAEDALLRTLAKPTDGFFSRHVNRRVSLWVTRRLMHTAILPNQVSVVTLLMGVAAGVVAALGGWAAALGGTLLFEAQSVFDGVDGELARLRYQRSPLGAWLDTISDDVTSNAYFIGLMINLAQAGIDWAVAVGALAVGAALGGRVIVYWLLATVYHTGDQFALSWDFTASADARGVRRVGVWLMTVMRAAIKRDCFVKAFVLLALVGRADVILVLACAFAVGYLLKLVPQTRRLLRARGPGRAVRRAPSRLAHVTAV